MSKYLIGKTITGLKIASDKKALLIQTSNGDCTVRVDGDCCSNSWIEHIELPALGFPALVSDVRDLEMPDLGSPSEDEVIAYYGCKIVTDRGDIIIDYRNESNGYYGGNLSWPDDNYFYGGVHGQNDSNMEWTDVIP